MTKLRAMGELLTKESMSEGSTLPRASLVRYLVAIALESLTPACFWYLLLGIQSCPPEREEEPPNLLPLSSIVTDAPAEEAERAATSPAAPDPTTITSYGCFGSMRLSAPKSIDTYCAAPFGKSWRERGGLYLDSASVWLVCCQHGFEEAREPLIEIILAQ